MTEEFKTNNNTLKLYQRAELFNNSYQEKKNDLKIVIWFENILSSHELNLTITYKKQHNYINEVHIQSLKVQVNKSKTFLAHLLCRTGGMSIRRNEQGFSY